MLLRRYRRFLADVRFPTGAVATVHCANPGSMAGCCEPGRPVLLSESADPRRKLRFTWEMIRMGRTWVGVNTAVANRVVAAWLETGRLFPGRGAVAREVACGNSRFDFAVGEGLLEVKSVSLVRDGIAAFPDAVTERGRRHCEELARARRQGRPATLLFFVTRADAAAVRPADEIDPAYGAALRLAAEAGVEVAAVRARFSPRGVEFGGLLPVRL